MQQQQLTQTDIRQVFSRRYKGDRNFMTPSVVRFGQHGVYIYELSKGDWMGSDIYGLTFIKTDDLNYDCSDMNGCHNSLDEVETALKVSVKV